MLMSHLGQKLQIMLYSGQTEVVQKVLLARHLRQPAVASRLMESRPALVNQAHRALGLFIDH